MRVLNGIPEAAEEVIAFYDRYIQTMATESVYTTEGNTIGYYYDEDLAQELRIALVQSLPAVRQILIKKYFVDHPAVTFSKDHTK